MKPSTQRPVAIALQALILKSIGEGLRDSSGTVTGEKGKQTRFGTSLGAKGIEILLLTHHFIQRFRREFSNGFKHLVNFLPKNGFRKW